MNPCIKIGNRQIEFGSKPYFIAELSGNHQQCIAQAQALIKYAKQCGADAVKLQTYTADTLTLPVYTKEFQVHGPWENSYLYDLYKTSYTPWEWHEELADYANKLGITLFSTPFDETAVDFLEKVVNPPVYKIASFELNHIPLLKKVARTEKPIILSTGMGTLEEIDEAVDTLKDNGCKQLILLKCISAYPANPKDFNLRSIESLHKRYHCPIGLSDHSLAAHIVHGAITFGACVIEKHIVLNRKSKSVDSSFSLEPEEFSQMVKSSLELYEALGSDKIGPCSQEISQKQLQCKRSIYASKTIHTGEVFTSENLKIIRPAFGLAPKHWDQILGKTAYREFKMGTPLTIQDLDNQ